MSPELVVALELYQATRSTDPIADRYHAFMLDPGLGPPTYITSDGRLIWDEADIWRFIPTMNDALIGVAVGIEKTKIILLNTILPQKPNDAISCHTCKGTGSFEVPINNIPKRFFCKGCGSLGWTSPCLLLSEVVA